MARLHDLLPTLRMVVGLVMPLVLRWFRRLAYSVGLLSLAMIVLAFTRIPFDVHRWLGTGPTRCGADVEAIMVLGGSGMPSGPELLRLHRAAEMADELPLAAVFVVHPGDPSQIRLMEQELLLRGVDRGRITLINEGDNTREQALACLQRCSPAKPVITLVTAPENVYRTVLTFQRVGFDRGVCGDAAWDHAMDHAFHYRHQRIGGKAWVPDVSEAPGLRYTFWNYLKLEITCLREFVAIAYYWANGWL